MVDDQKKRHNHMQEIMDHGKSAGEVVVITGVARGLGRAMAFEFADQGHCVIGCSRNEKKLLSLAEKLGDGHSFSVVDVANDKAVTTWVDASIDEFGVPDLLLNNAAVINKSKFLWELSAVEFDEVVDINIKGVANVIRHFLPRMARNQKGVIVNFSSGWGRSASPEVAPYCATKYAIEGLTQALALELPEGMAAVPLNPGIINTDMLRSCFGPSAADFASPTEWARTAVPFLLNLGPQNNGQSMTIG
jgi:NAD(P)-dependent dehydrogenase (short-subunit alcohol dehydrogenase family)